MKVTPVKKNFRKHKPGDVFDLPDKSAKILIHVGRLAPAPQGYQTRMLTAEPVFAVPAISQRTAEQETQAPYGYKADGTPRKIAPPKPKVP